MNGFQFNNATDFLIMLLGVMIGIMVSEILNLTKNEMIIIFSLGVGMITIIFIKTWKKITIFENKLKTFEVE